MASLVWMVKDSFVLTQRSIRHIIRSFDQVMALVTFPVMFMLLNRYVLGGAIDTGDVSYVNYLFAGILVQTLAFGANYTTINLAVDMQQGIVSRFRSLPMHNSAIVIGHILSDLLRNIISGIIIVVIGFIIGFRPSASISEWLGVIIIALLFTLTISCLSAILGLLVKTVEAAQWMGFVVIFPLTFVSSAFVPTETLPKVLRVFAENQPLTQVINAIRSWLVGTEMNNAASIAAIWCIAIIIFSITMTTILFRKVTEK